jgi:hypothetical protein
MNTLIILLFTLVFVFNAYCALKCYNLYRSGVVIVGGRISLSKLRRSLEAAKDETAQREIRRFRRLYMVYLICFYGAFLAALISFFWTRSR